MKLDAWIYAKPAEWEALSSGTLEGGDLVIFSRVHAQAITGFWKSFPGGFEIYNVLGTQEEIQEIIDALPSTTIVYAWTQGNGADSLDSPWAIDSPANILAVMRDNTIHDGTDWQTVPATEENPNWGHMFYGQIDRIFAGDFNEDFSEDFR